METGFSFGCFRPIWMIGRWAAPPSQHTHLRLAPPQWVHTPGAGGLLPPGTLAMDTRQMARIGPQRRAQLRNPNAGLCVHVCVCVRYLKRSTYNRYWIIDWDPLFYPRALCRLSRLWVCVWVCVCVCDSQWMPLHCRCSTVPWSAEVVRRIEPNRPSFAQMSICRLFNSTDGGCCASWRRNEGATVNRGTVCCI